MANVKTGKRVDKAMIAAKDAGRAAFVRGNARNDNPHDLDSLCGKAWREGWTEAHAEHGGRWPGDSQ